jgi:hypothetical protein
MGITMKKMFVVLALATSVFVASCSTLPTAQPDRTTLRKTSHDLTHLLVDKDATLVNSISEILPKGVYRISPAELSKLTVRSTVQMQTLVRADTFSTGKTKADEVRNTLGAPVRESKGRDGSFVYSYDASDGSIVTYFFAPDGSILAPGGTLAALYGYHVSVH